jgi:hypothetical protein
VTFRAVTTHGPVSSGPNVSQVAIGANVIRGYNRSGADAVVATVGLASFTDVSFLVLLTGWGSGGSRFESVLRPIERQGGDVVDAVRELVEATLLDPLSSRAGAYWKRVRDASRIGNVDSQEIRCFDSTELVFVVMMSVWRIVR